MSNNAKTRYSIIAMVCSLWFAFTAWLWTYYINLFIALPAGIAVVYFVNKRKAENALDQTGRAAILILLIGTIISIVSGLMYR